MRLSGGTADPGKRAGTESRPYTGTGSFCGGPMYRHRPLRDVGDGASRTPPPTEGTGDADCRVGPTGLLAMTVFLSFRGAKRRGNPFLSQEGPALYMAGEEMRLSVMGHDCQGSAERSGERGDSSWSIRFLPDNLRVQHGVGGAEV